ncbi:MAG: D-glycero-beta-D-manno-heptose 1-phosphate adenylyltransferase [Phycisphaerae bacterium]
MNIVSGFGTPRIALIGDFMLDRYVYGSVERINPEAPVPVLKTERSEARVGGAGNVAEAVLALGGKVHCVGVVGKDQASEELSRLLMVAGAETSALVGLQDRPTSVKTRYVGLAQHRHAQQMLRVDEENTHPLPETVRRTLRAATRGTFSSVDVLAVEDYNKGVLNDENTPEIIADARKAGLKVLVDPALLGDYSRYRGATLLTPNRYEASVGSGIEIVDGRTLHDAAERLLQVTEAEAMIITMDKEGAYLLTRDGTELRIPPVKPRSVYDVTGAGDEVLATLAVALAEDVELVDAIELANVAGGLEVEKFGVVPITRKEIMEELRSLIGLRGSKILNRKKLVEELAIRRKRGEKIVFTNGCFDLLHLGHVKYLQQARELGNCLIVAVNSDDSVRRLKGPSRPVIGENERAEMLGSLECVDYVTIFPEDTPVPLLELLKPDILVKGGTTQEVVGREVVEKTGGRVLTLDAVDGLSTTEIITRIVETNK